MLTQVWPRHWVWPGLRSAWKVSGWTNGCTFCSTCETLPTPQLRHPLSHWKAVCVVFDNVWFLVPLSNSPLLSWFILFEVTNLMHQLRLISGPDLSFLTAHPQVCASGDVLNLHLRQPSTHTHNAIAVLGFTVRICRYHGNQAPFSMWYPW